MIGDYDHPKTRLPGAGGAPEIAAELRRGGRDRSRTPADVRATLDFARPSATATARATASGSASAAGTDRGDHRPRRARARSRHAGADADPGARRGDAEQVQEATGWELSDRLDEPADTEPPTAAGAGGAAGAGESMSDPTAMASAWRRERSSRDRIYDPVAETPTSYLREGPDAHPPLDYPPATSRPRCATRSSRSSTCRRRVTEITGPQLGADAATSASTTTISPSSTTGEPIGERIIVSGRRAATPRASRCADTLVEIWQANAAGRYRHRWDRWPAPLDPNFTGAGRCVTDDEGRYRVHDDQAGPVPVGQPLQRLAAGAHPLLAAGPGVRAAAGDADVLPGRPVLPV